MKRILPCLIVASLLLAGCKSEPPAAAPSTPAAAPAPGESGTPPAPAADDKKSP